MTIQKNNKRYAIIVIENYEKIRYNKDIIEIEKEEKWLRKKAYLY